MSDDVYCAVIERFMAAIDSYAKLEADTGSTKDPHALKAIGMARVMIEHLGIVAISGGMEGTFQSCVAVLVDTVMQLRRLVAENQGPEALQAYDRKIVEGLTPILCAVRQDERTLN